MEPALTQLASDDWQLLEALLIGAQSLTEMEEAIALFPPALSDEALGEWAADGRYEWLEQHKASLPLTAPQPLPLSHDFSPDELPLMYRLLYCQSLAEASRIKAELMAINPDFAGRYWQALSSQSRQRIRGMKAAYLPQAA